VAAAPAAVCSSAAVFDSLSVRAAVCDSRLSAPVHQCSSAAVGVTVHMQQCAAVQQCTAVCGTTVRGGARSSARGSVRQCVAVVRQCASVRQCGQCAAMLAAVRQRMWGSAALYGNARGGSVW
jgi:hypothetical protein